MELQQIRYFLAVCEEQSFTRAAKRCCVRQPSVSNAIGQLEIAVGGELFVRSRPVRLTRLGAALLPLFAQIDEWTERARTIAVTIPMATSFERVDDPTLPGTGLLTAQH